MYTRVYFFPDNVHSTDLFLGLADSSFGFLTVLHNFKENRL